VTFDTMPPAGAVLSTESMGTICSVPCSTACGAARFGTPVKYAMVVPVSVIPSGVRIRLATKSSQLMPPMAETISPATMYSTLS
jgi:hypothetical protein